MVLNLLVPAYFLQVSVVVLKIFISDSISNNGPDDCGLVGERLSSLVVTGALKACCPNSTEHGFLLICRPNSTECDLLGERLLLFVLTGMLTCCPHSTECAFLGERLLTLAVTDLLTYRPKCGLLPTSEDKLHLLDP